MIPYVHHKLGHYRWTVKKLEFLLFTDWKTELLFKIVSLSTIGGQLSDEHRESSDLRVYTGVRTTKKPNFTLTFNNPGGRSVDILRPRSNSFNMIRFIKVSIQLRACTPIAYHFVTHDFFFMFFSVKIVFGLMNNGFSITLIIRWALSLINYISGGDMLWIINWGSGFTMWSLVLMIYVLCWDSVRSRGDR